VTEFDLRALLAPHLAEPGDIHRAKLVRDLLNEIPPRHREAALAQALPAYVAHEVTSQRRGTSIRPSDAPATGKRVRPLPARSAKRERISAWWRRALEEKYATATPGVAKSLGDMDRTDLLFAIRVREIAAEKTAAKAAALRGLLELLDEHGAARVRDLPDTVLAAVLVKAEAA
jgi:hypothetical protein